MSFTNTGLTEVAVAVTATPVPAAPTAAASVLPLHLNSERPNSSADMHSRGLSTAPAAPRSASRSTASKIGQVVSVLNMICLTAFALYQMTRHTYYALLTHRPFLGAVLALIFYGSYAAFIFSWFRTVTTDPGALAPWMRASRVEAAVVNAVRSVCVRELGANFESEDLVSYLETGASVATGAYDSGISSNSYTHSNALGDGLLNPALLTPGYNESVKVSAAMAVSAVARLQSDPAGGSTGGGGGGADGASSSSSSSTDGSDSDPEDGEASADPVVRARHERRKRRRDAKQAARRALEVLEDNADSHHDGVGGGYRVSAVMLHPPPHSSSSAALSGPSGRLTTTTTTTTEVRRAMARRRRRRQRHGLAVVSLGQAALEAYVKIRDCTEESNSGGGVCVSVAAVSRQQERAEVISFLLDRAEYCAVCNCYETQRIRHCQHCCRCSVGQDMHCFLIGCCIGQDNYKFLVLLELYMFVALMPAVVATLVVVIVDWDFFFRFREVNLGYYLGFYFAVTATFTSAALLIQHVFVSIGRGVSNGDIVRRERQLMRQREVRNGEYSPVMTEDPLPEPGRFRLANFRRVFGEDARVWTWLVPTVAPPRPRDDARAEAFRVGIAETVESSLAAVAQATRDDDEEDEDDDNSNNGRGTADVGSPTADEVAVTFNRPPNTGGGLRIVAGGAGSVGSAGGAAAPKDTAEALVNAYMNYQDSPGLGPSLSTAATGVATSRGTSAGAIPSAVALPPVSGGIDGAPPRVAGMVVGASGVTNATAITAAGPPTATTATATAAWLSTAPASDASATAAARPAIQRIPFFAKRGVSTTTTATTTTSTTTAAVASGQARSGDPLEAFSMPAAVTATASSSSTAASATATPSVTPPHTTSASAASAAAGTLSILNDPHAAARLTFQKVGGHHSKAD